MIQLTEEQSERLRQIREQHQQRIEQNRDDTDSHFDIDFLLSLFDAAEPDYRPNTMNAEKDKAQMNWQQVALNGGPPCFFVEGPQYCGRAERWPGHGNEAFHKFVSLDDLLATARKEAFKEARHRVYMISGSTNVDPSVRKGFAAGVQAAIEVIAALERVATTDKENDA